MAERPFNLTVLKSAPEDADLAAIVAAVRYYISSQEIIHSSETALPKAGISSWRQASYLEGSGRVGKVFSRQQLSGMVALLVLAASTLGPLRAFAADNFSTARPAGNLIAASTARTVPSNMVAPTIRVGLAFKVNQANFESIDGAQVRDAATGKLVALLPPQTRWTATIDQQTIAITGRDNQDLAQLPDTASGSRIAKAAFVPAAPGERRFSATGTDGILKKRLVLPWTADAKSSGYLIVTPKDAQDISDGVIPDGELGTDDEIVSFNGKLYRGMLWLRPQVDAINGTITFSVINVVDLEDYLLSVVASEMPSNWPMEALKAQAIAARSYAMANLGKHERDGYDVKASTEDQVYSGIETEKQPANEAVSQTDGIVMKNGGNPICAFFHSTSGGCTETPELALGKSIPYLKSVVDYDDESPHAQWSKKVAVSDLETQLGKDIVQDVGQVLSITVVSRTDAQRVSSALIAGTNGTRIVSGETLRRYLKLPSTIFNVGTDQGAYVFAGRGWGHGLGLSQWGAKALAEHGYNAAQILTYYYKDIALEYIGTRQGS